MTMSISPANYFYRDFSNENANISIKNRGEMCDLAYSFKGQKLLIFTLSVLALLSLLTMILLYFVYRNKEVRRIYSLVEIDLKFIFVIGFISYVVATLNLFAFFSYHLLILLIDLPPCFYVIDGNFCFYGQITFTSICPIICLLIFFTMFLERCYVSAGFRSNGSFIVLLISFILALYPILKFGIFDPRTYKNERVFCASLITSFDSNFKSAAYTTAIVEFGISLLDFLLLLFNKRKIDAYRKANGFDLDTRFNLKSIELSIKFIYPISLANSMTFCLQSIVYFIYYEYVNSMSLANSVLMFEMCNLGRVLSNLIVIGTVLCLNCFYRRKSTCIAPMNEADIHFREFRNIIA